MKNTNDAFERALKESLEGYEVPYNSADWAQLDQRMSKGDAKRGRWSTGLLALLFGGGLALATTVYYMIAWPANGDLADVAATADDVNQPHQAVALPIAIDQPEGDLSDNTNAGESPEAAIASVNPGPTPSAARIAEQQPASMAKPFEPSASVSAVTSPVAMKATSNSDISIKPSITEGCPGTSVVFEVTSMPDSGTRMLWNFGDGSFSTDPAPKHAYNKAGRYEVTLSMSSHAGGTIFNKPVSDVIVIHERPEAAFNPMAQEYLDRVPSVHFENKSLKGSNYAWDFGDGHTSTAQVPTHVFKNKGDYTVSLVVTNAIGCSDRTERVVRIKEDYNLLAAPAFSPNGDGVEESFIPDALKTLNRKFRMTIVDPSTGALIYETSDVKKPWNGRVNGVGAPSPTGDYVWMVEMKDGEALGGTYTGTVSLLR